MPSSCEIKDEPEFKPLQENWGLIFSQGFSGSIPLETENTGSLSHPYCCGKTPLEVLVESCLTSSVKDRESALILGRYAVHGAFLDLLY